MNSDIKVIGMAPLVYEFMGKKRKLRNVTLNEDIDLEVITLELANLPVPKLKTTQTVTTKKVVDVPIKITHKDGSVEEKTVQEEREVESEETVPYEEAMAQFKEEIEAFKLEASHIREKYLLALFDDGEITKEEARNVPIRDWKALRQTLTRQQYYDMGLTDAEIDELEQSAVKSGFQNQQILNQVLATQ